MPKIDKHKQKNLIAEHIILQNVKFHHVVEGFFFSLCEVKRSETEQREKKAPEMKTCFVIFVY